MDLPAQTVEELLESGMKSAQAQNSKSHGSPVEKSHDRYEGDDRDSEKHRSRGEKDDRDEDRHSANGSDRSRRHRSRESDEDRRSRRGHDSPRDRDRYRERGGRGSGDHYRGGRGRSRSPMNDSYRPSGRRDDRDRTYGRDRDYRRDRSPRRRDDRDRRDRRDDHEDRPRERERDTREKEPSNRKNVEITDDERDSRTIFVQQLAARARTKDVISFFSQVGEVRECTIVKDRISGRSKGVGYVEFKDLESVDKAIGLTGQKLLGIPIIAGLTEAEKNRQARKNEGQPTPSNGIPFHRLYVGNIHFSVTEEDLNQVFEPFGELEFVQLQKEEMGRSKGYGFVQFVNPEDAKTALQEMNGFEIAGRPIRVGLGNDKFTPETTASALNRLQNNNSSFQGSSFSGSGGRGAHAGGTTNFERSSGRDDKKAGGASALDDSDVGGVNFNNFSRDSLMKKLARIEDDMPSLTSGRGRVESKKPAVAKMNPSRCIVVKNAYNEAEETDPNWVKDLEDDFKTECSNKYGPVAFVGLYRDSNDGEIYVKFNDITGGDNALKGLNGRYFGGRTLTAQPVVDAIFNMNFPKAAKL